MVIVCGDVEVVLCADGGIPSRKRLHYMGSADCQRAFFCVVG